LKLLVKNGKKKTTTEFSDNQTKNQQIFFKNTQSKKIEKIKFNDNEINSKVNEVTDFISPKNNDKLCLSLPEVENNFIFSDQQISNMENLNINNNFEMNDNNKFESQSNPRINSSDIKEKSELKIEKLFYLGQKEEKEKHIKQNGLNSHNSPSDGNLTTNNSLNSPCQNINGLNLLNNNQVSRVDIGNFIIN
jgi:hypothetical protein